MVGCVRERSLWRSGVVWPPHVCTNSATEPERGASSSEMDRVEGPSLWGERTVNARERSRTLL